MPTALYRGTRPRDYVERGFVKGEGDVWVPETLPVAYEALRELSARRHPHTGKRMGMALAVVDPEKTNTRRIARAMAQNGHVSRYNRLAGDIPLLETPYVQDLFTELTDEGEYGENDGGVIFDRHGQLMATQVMFYNGDFPEEVARALAEIRGQAPGTRFLGTLCSSRKRGVRFSMAQSGSGKGSLVTFIHGRIVEPYSRRTRKC